MKYLAQSSGAIQQAQTVLEASAAPDDVPTTILSWLARLRLLEGTPFSYLVPHSDLLPPESIRFFYLNRNWTDAAVDGALSVGAVTNRDRSLLSAVHSEIRAKIDSAERNLRPGEELAVGEAEVATGFLLRSRAVSGWPGLEIHADRRNGTNYQRMRLLRIERLAPAVLLVMIDGIPDRIRIEEPRQGIQFGVDVDAGGSDLTSWAGVEATARIKDPSSGLLVGQDGVPLAVGPDTALADDGKGVKVPFRAGAPGVIHVAELAERMKTVTVADKPLVSGTGSSAEFAVQMLQFPFCQPFESTEPTPGWFVTTAPVAIVALSHGETL
ncbi:MAG: hypothetical protein U9N84_06600 [Actinomycetota bacterium]|nr:hypothetical protein [Actinomycetota bacterium]